MPVKFHRDTINITCALAASRLCGKTSCRLVNGGPDSPTHVIIKLIHIWRMLIYCQDTRNVGQKRKRQPKNGVFWNDELITLFLYRKYYHTMSKQSSFYFIRYVILWKVAHIISLAFRGYTTQYATRGRSCMMIYATWVIVFHIDSFQSSKKLHAIFLSNYNTIQLLLFSYILIQKPHGPMELWQNKHILNKYVIAK